MPPGLPSTLILATRNRHKAGEIRALLGSACRYLTLADLPDPPAVVEDGRTFAENAAKKARALASWLAQRGAVPGSGDAMVLADDSGLEVDALAGAPGVHSARFAALDTGSEGNSTDGDNNAKLLRLLKDVPDGGRTARFRCVVALARIPGQRAAPGLEFANQDIVPVELFEGTCEGRIGWGPRGRGGFGYDPLFIPQGFEQSFAELGEAQKNRISHRARALRKVKARLEG